MRKELRLGNALAVALMSGASALVAMSCGESPPGDRDASVSGGTENDSAKIVAYYFHKTIRCETCLKIESSARQAIEDGFAPDLASGTVEWRVLNMDLKENQRYVKEYDLSVPTLVLSKVRKGQQAAWKDLFDVWDLLDDPGAFRRYVQGELSKYLGPDDGPAGQVKAER